MPDAIVEISKLDFAYGPRLILKEIDLVVRPGVTLGVIGPNGGGKTTLMRLMLGLLQPTRGTLRVDGLAPRAAVRRGNVIGYLPQNPAMPQDFPINLRQFVELGLVGKTGLLHSPEPQDLRHVEHLIEQTGIAELADAPIGSLSGGELQRAFIARALAAKPRILLLDEPTTGVDRAGQDQFVQFLDNLKASLDLTVILVSHDLRTVAAACDRLACLNVKLHFHDVPANLPSELAQEIFGADLPELRSAKAI